MDSLQYALLNVAIVCFMLALFFAALATLCHVLAYCMEEVGKAIAKLWGKDESDYFEDPPKGMIPLEGEKLGYVCVEITGFVVSNHYMREWEDFCSNITALASDSRYEPLSLEVT